MVACIIKMMRYFPRMGFERKLQEIVEPVYIATQRHSFALGYKPTKKELREIKKKNQEEIRPYKKALNGYFVKERDDFPFCRFPEPWVDVTNKRVNPVFEIFFDHIFTEYVEPFFLTLKLVVHQD